MQDAHLDHLTYPLPPWRHSFRTLSVFCGADGDRVSRLLPPHFELRESVLQITVMRFDSTVPERPYFDSAVIAPVRYQGLDGGYWVHGYTSTGEVLSATREIWGFRMKLADRIALSESGVNIRGETHRLGSTLISLELEPTGEAFDVPDTFPRLFWKVLPQADRPEALVDQVVRMQAETEILETVWGRGAIEIQGTAADPLHELGPLEVRGASLVSGNQVLPWGDLVP